VTIFCGGNDTFCCRVVHKFWHARKLPVPHILIPLLSHIMSGILSFAGGVPLGVSIAALTVAFNYRTADWLAETKKARLSDDKRYKRSSELRRHFYLLGLGTLGVACAVLARTNPLFILRAAPVANQATLGPIGVSWGGAATVIGAVCDEWEEYGDGAKVSITGASLVGLLWAAAMV
jgi:hypothetical protein